MLRLDPGAEVIERIGGTERASPENVSKPPESPARTPRQFEHHPVREAKAVKVRFSMTIRAWPP
jgi:hypothetical protein